MGRQVDRRLGGLKLSCGQSKASYEFLKTVSTLPPLISHVDLLPIFDEACNTAKSDNKDNSFKFLVIALLISCPLYWIYHRHLTRNTTTSRFTLG